jgi:2-methylcitrate dehydratase PrpD
MLTASEKLSKFGAELRFEDLPTDVVRSVQLRLLDVFGCALAAYGLGELPGVARALSAGGGAEPGATAIGFDRPMTPHDAALVNGALCHGLDYDDTHPGAIAHVSAVVMPSALAACEHFGRDGRDFITSMVVGYEVISRIGAAVRGDFHDRGLHATSICGVFGAAATVCRARQLDADTFANALGIAGSLASGTLEFLADGSSTKRLHPGFAAHGGVIAAALACAGETGPAGVLEGDSGLYRAFLGRDDPEITGQTADLGERWETLRIAAKPYPVCHFSHPPIRALGEAMAAHGIHDGDVETVVAIVPSAFVQHILEPVEQKLAPRNAYDARFSLPFALGVTLVRGQLDVTCFDDQTLTDRSVLAAAAKVRYEVHDFGGTAGEFSGGVRIELVDGRTVTAGLEVSPGGAEAAMSEDDIRAKWRTNASRAMSLDDVHELEARLLSISEAPDMSDLAASLASLGQAVGPATR